MIFMIVVIGLFPACGANSDPEPLEIELFSSSTKEDWINVATESFNAEQVITASGRPIVVNVEHGNSGGSQRRILDRELEPTAWSPGEMSWVDGANQAWQERTGRPLVLGECAPTVYVPTGFAMWRPMAEAMGWPDQRIGWSDILTLASDPQGWARYNHPEWGQLKLGLTNPTTSNSGRLILTALAYGVLDQTHGLTPGQVMSEPVIEAMGLLQERTSEHGEQSARLIERMVTQGPDQLHAVNTNEAEIIKSNARYGKQIPYQFVAIIPKEGTFWAEHPFCILETEWVTEEQREAARLYMEYLLEPEQQALAVTKGLRPANPTVPLGPPISLENGTDPSVSPPNTPALASPSAAVGEAVKELFQRTQNR